MKKRPQVYAVSSVTPALGGGYHATESIGTDVSLRRLYGIPCFGGVYPDLTQSVIHTQLVFSFRMALLGVGLRGVFGEARARDFSVRFVVRSAMYTFPHSLHLFEMRPLASWSAYIRPF
jgi:hypothetical protein